MNSPTQLLGGCGLKCGVSRMCRAISSQNPRLLVIFYAMKNISRRIQLLDQVTLTPVNSWLALILIVLVGHTPCSVFFYDGG